MTFPYMTISLWETHRVGVFPYCCLPFVIICSSVKTSILGMNVSLNTRRTFPSMAFLGDTRWWCSLRIMSLCPHDVLCGMEGNPEMPGRQFSYLQNNRVGGNNLSYARQLICDGNMNNEHRYIILQKNLLFLCSDSRNGSKLGQLVMSNFLILLRIS